jgi:hypothetical protein
VTILHPRPSREQVIVKPRKPGQSISVIVKGRPKVRRSTRKCCRGDERNFSRWPRRICLRGPGAGRSKWRSPRPEAGQNPYRKVEGMQRAVGKAAEGERVFIGGNSQVHICAILSIKSCHHLRPVGKSRIAVYRLSSFGGYSALYVLRS